MNKFSSSADHLEGIESSPIGLVMNVEGFAFRPYTAEPIFALAYIALAYIRLRHTYWFQELSERSKTRCAVFLYHTHVI